MESRRNGNSRHGDGDTCCGTAKGKVKWDYCREVKDIQK